MVEAIPGGSPWRLQEGNVVFLSCIDLHLARKELLYSGSPTPSSFAFRAFSYWRSATVENNKLPQPLTPPRLNDPRSSEADDPPSEVSSEGQSHCLILHLTSHHVGILSSHIIRKMVTVQRYFERPHSHNLLQDTVIIILILFVIVNPLLCLI